MKLREEFRVDQPVAAVWEFFEQPELVARCIPGVEQIRVIDPDHVEVLATQRIGPMSATFEAKVTVLEREREQYIRFQAAGRSVRGAVGNMRTSNTVRLAADDNDGTEVSVEADVVLAGALGSVGQKVVAKQAGKVTSVFAENLRQALVGEIPAPLPATPDRDAPTRPAMAPAASGPDGWAQASPGGSGSRPDPWSKIAAGLSVVSAGLSLAILLRQRRGR